MSSARLARTGGSALTRFAILSLLLLAAVPSVQALDGVPVPDAVLVVPAGEHVLLAWAPDGRVEASDVYGVRGDETELLGTAPPGVTTFLAPAGYDAYMIGGSSGHKGDPCLYVISTLPPVVSVNVKCLPVHYRPLSLHRLLP